LANATPSFRPVLAFPGEMTSSFSGFFPAMSYVVLGALLSAAASEAARDVLTEALVEQVFRDSIKASLGRRPAILLDSEVDPLRLWPIDERLKEKAFEADFYACDVHLHNLKSAALERVRVERRTLSSSEEEEEANR